MEFPSFNKDSTILADEFLRSFGVMTDFHKNNLILVTMCSCNKLRNVIFRVDQKKKVIEADLQLSRFGLLFYRKKKIVDQLSSIYSEYIPDYEFRIKFTKYVPRKQQPASDQQEEATKA